MRFVIFTHSLLSDWNHGNAHFLRGVATELHRAGHDLRIFEPRDGWSLQNLIARARQPADLRVRGRLSAAPQRNFYDLDELDLDRALDGADVVIVHEWNPHELVRCHRRASRGCTTIACFSTTRITAASPTRTRWARTTCSNYDGVLAYGGVIRDLYLQNGWAQRRMDLARSRGHARVPSASPTAAEKLGDLVWVGNWGDDERTEEIREFLSAR